VLLHPAFRSRRHGRAWQADISMTALDRATGVAASLSERRGKRPFDRVRGRVKSVANGVTIEISEMPTGQGFFEAKRPEQIAELITDAGPAEVLTGGHQERTSERDDQSARGATTVRFAR
jgi:hypothetical protein